MAENKAVIKECPYWNPRSQQTCALTSGGLYIPIEEHIKRFCLSLSWNLCCHYTRGCEQLLDSNWKRGLSQEPGQRRYPRFAFRYGLALLRSAESFEQAAEGAENAAITLDLGEGGMRVETGIDLNEGARVSFVFGKDFIVPGLTGQAEVRWRGEIRPDGTRHCGLGFTDQKSGWAMGELLRPKHLGER